MSDPGLHATESEGRLRLDGDLGFASARRLWTQARALLPRPGSVVVDLGGVGRADSAGVALLVYWTREQRRLGGDVEFVNIPEQMKAIARVTGVDAILPLARG